MTSTLDAVAHEVRRAVIARTDEIVQTLVDLVRIPTEAPPGSNYREVVDHLIPEFAALGFTAEPWIVPTATVQSRLQSRVAGLEGERTNLLANFDVEGVPKAALYCHLDTVPVGDRTRWTVEAHGGLVSDGYVWGRGSSDSKAGCAAILSAFRILGELGIEPAIAPVVALTTDEEVGCYTGLMHMADEGVFSECSWLYSCDAEATSVLCGSNGGFTWRVVINGKSTHSGNAYLGLNPIEHSIPLLRELMRVKNDVEERRSTLRMSPDMALVTGRDYINPALNVTIAHGGERHNVIPSTFTIEGDRRFLPEENEERCVVEIEEAIARAVEEDPDLDCQLNVTPFHTSFATDPNDSWVRRVCQVASLVRGDLIDAGGVGGSTDIAYVARVTGMPVAAHGVARMAETGNHGSDERCRIEDLLAITQIVALLVGTSGDDADE